MITYKLHLLRHGLTAGNLRGEYIGVTDLPLCEEGLDKLQDLLEENDYPAVGKVYTSPLSRCVQTAQMLYPETFLERVPKLAEMNFGSFEGKSIAQLKGREEFLRWMEGGKTAAPPNGESAGEFAKRLQEGLDEIFRDMMDSRIPTAALVTHGGVIMNLLAQFGYPKNEAKTWACQAGCGYTIQVTPQFWMRDRLFEIVDAIPHPKAMGNGQWQDSYEDDYDWRQDV